ncbi:ferredoxin [Novosphingobium profundi]|uniref:Ferredoxin n=1 Tax=Novosphingobium aureum TaxID=2792964 RepID=A0A931HFX8_9SPHN|nr:MULTISPECIES: ferredoxin [Novosphingobium]MBH0114644.1 ferredoxin [Novosphingobium aureum]MBT0668943.1 ferredoxin [Novosphingobium profundi]
MPMNDRQTEGGTTGDRWTVESRCINCMASRSIAPELLVEKSGQSVFARQPETDKEIEAAWKAAQLCPVGAVRPPDGLPKYGPLFPEEVAGYFRMGHNTKGSYGAHSYFGRAGDMNFLVDGPGWSTRLASWMEQRGGLDHILLTHRDDIGDTKRYAEYFGADVWIHQADADAAPFANRIIHDDDLASPHPEIRIVPIPGHTRGSVAYLVAGDTLFTGDTLAWDHNERRLRGYRRYCWFDWDQQIASIAALRGLGFSRIFAGHGGSIEMSAPEMVRHLDDLLRREGAE